MRLPFTKSKVAASPQNLTTPPTDGQVIRAKLATVEQEIAAAETELRQASLAAALSDDPDAGFDTVARLNGLRSRKELLQAALQAAEQAERDRLAALHAREWAARKRSLAQKSGALLREVDAVARASTELDQARRRMAEVGAGMVALLPVQLRNAQKPYSAMLSGPSLREMADLELFRLDPNTRSKPTLRLVEYIGSVQDPRTGALREMRSLVGDLVAGLKTEFDHLAPTAPEPSGLSAPKAQPPLPDAMPPADDYTVDLRGKLGPVPEAAPEAAGEPEAEPSTEHSPDRNNHASRLRRGCAVVLHHHHHHGGHNER
jgi:hypothetical protein